MKNIFSFNNSQIGFSHRIGPKKEDYFDLLILCKILFLSLRSKPNAIFGEFYILGLCDEIQLFKLYLLYLIIAQIQLFTLFIVFSLICLYILKNESLHKLISMSAFLDYISTEPIQWGSKRILSSLPNRGVESSTLVL